MLTALLETMIKKNKQRPDAAFARKLLEGSCGTKTSHLENAHHQTLKITPVIIEKHIISVNHNDYTW
jgi:hypothetical protein